ncbi:probable G-protein coupled receptor 139 [Ruditapes philippinarum]|uniref:probable G-protein coupled receptor 139 n=1 Tax=Ruditapes philippinarum TaxID=129788 RepID=UPI00295A5766|nr:probable G-protein coupled receptor 139 [Ruditapes philippinarum]XP_060582808.1 probable G-protein coupled receptor 139 [Ruditapes philippinarum]XP_060582809.1 probable G-protein coupled receptor 139 [Ruditapes philippinarum]
MTEEFKLKIVDKILTIYPPILLSIGLTGNILSVIVLAQASTRKTSTGFTLIFLTVTDTLILINSVLVRWLSHMFEINLRSSSNGACKFHVFMSYVLFQLSPWILVFVTVERVFSVKYPHRVRDVFTRKRVIRGLLILVLVLSSANAHLIYGYEHVYKEAYYCTARSNHEDFMFKYWTWIDFALAFVIPFCVLLCGNIIVIHKLKLSERFQKSTSITTQSGQELRGNLNRRGNNTASHFTMTAVILNITFSCLVSPFSIFAIGQPYWFPHETLSSEEIVNLTLIGTILLMLLHTNSAINFVLYIFCGSKFRRDFMNIFCKRQRSLSVQSFCSQSLSTLNY